MTLQQLRFLAAIVESDFNITAAATKLNATQPAVSRQLLLLERELGFQIFSRNGRGLGRMTDAGEKVIEHARRALREAQNIRNVSAELNDPRRGELRVGSTHTEARYVLPNAIHRFRSLFPGVRLSLHQGTPEQIAEMVRLNQLDLVMATGSKSLFGDLVFLSCYQESRRVIVPTSHPLAGAHNPTLAKLGSFPLASHVSETSETPVEEIFGKAGIEPQIVLTSRDADIVKTYVRLGLAVGIIAGVAFDPERDDDLVPLDASHLFPAETTWAGFSRRGVLRQYTYDFLGLLAPHITRDSIERARDLQPST